MAGTSADKIKSLVYEKEKQDLRDKLNTLDDQYRDFFMYSEKTMHLLEKENQSHEVEMAEKEALLLEKIILEDYLFSQAREIILEKDRILSEKSALIAEKESIIIQKDNMLHESNAALLEKTSIIAEMNLMIHQKNLIILQKNAAIDEKMSIIAQRESTISEKDLSITHKDELISHKDSVISSSPGLISIIGVATAGVLAGIFLNQRKS